MGFGTLFVGFLFFLNVTPYAVYTDPIGALVLLTGLLKLSPVNRAFRRAAAADAVFAGFAVLRLFLSVLTLFGVRLPAPLTATLAVLRCLLLGAALFLLFSGIASVSREVDERVLYVRASFARASGVLLFSLLALSEIPGLFGLFGVQAAGWISFVLLLLFLIWTGFAAIAVIYRAYMRICMPGEDILPPESLGLDRKRKK